MRSRSARVGGAFRYSITSTSTPRSPRISSAPRDLLHTGLWYTRIVSELLVMARRLPPVDVGERRHRAGRATASATSSRYRSRGTSTAPSDARCGVVHCTSSNVPPPVAQQVDERDDRDLRRVGDPVELRLRREQSADRTRRRARRRARPDRRPSSCHVSTLCAQPSRCSSVYAAMNFLSIHPCGRRGSAQPRITSSNAVSIRISKRRVERRKRSAHDAARRAG